MPAPEIIPQQVREHLDPYEAYRPVPWVVIVIIAALTIFGSFYIENSEINIPSSWGDGRSRADLTPAAQKSGPVNGKAAYAAICAPCHQATGTGIPGAFPPLAKSEWANSDGSIVSTIVLNGISGTFIVNGTTYNGVMPTFKTQLTDDQISAILSFVRTQWGNSSPPISAETVAAAREATSDRTGPFAGNTELKLPQEDKDAK